MRTLLVLYHSRTGSVANMAHEIAEIAQANGLEVLLRTFEQQSDDDIVVSLDDLKQCDGLAFGCPTRFGMMPGIAKSFWDSTSETWLKGHLIDKPACVFTSSSSMHGGNETTLLGMALPLLHHGMLLMGIPYDVPELNKTTTGGSPYGASHVSGITNTVKLSSDERTLCISLAKRLTKHINRHYD